MKCEIRERNTHQESHMNVRWYALRSHLSLNLAALLQLNQFMSSVLFISDLTNGFGPQGVPFCVCV